MELLVALLTWLHNHLHAHAHAQHAHMCMCMRMSMCMCMLHMRRVILTTRVLCSSSTKCLLALYIDLTDSPTSNMMLMNT